MVFSQPFIPFKMHPVLHEAIIVPSECCHASVCLDLIGVDRGWLSILLNAFSRFLISLIFVRFGNIMFVCFSGMRGIQQVWTLLGHPLRQ